MGFTHEIDLKEVDSPDPGHFILEDHARRLVTRAAFKTHENKFVHVTFVVDTGCPYHVSIVPNHNDNFERPGHCGGVSWTGCLQPTLAPTSQQVPHHHHTRAASAQKSDWP